MEEIVKLLDENLEYVKHEVSGDRITIWVKSAKKEVICPYCGKPSKKVHSRYERSFQDLPIQGKKTTIVEIRRKMFCLLYKPVEEVEAISKELYNKIIQRYPKIDKFVNGLKSVLDHN